MIDDAGLADTVDVEVDGGIGAGDDRRRRRRRRQRAHRRQCAVPRSGGPRARRARAARHWPRRPALPAGSARFTHPFRTIAGECSISRPGHRAAAPHSRARRAPSAGPRPAMCSPRSPCSCPPTRPASWPAGRSAGCGGVVAVDMVTLYRLAELIGSPSLRAERPLAGVDVGGRPRRAPRARRQHRARSTPSPSTRRPSSRCATSIASSASPAPTPWPRSTASSRTRPARRRASVTLTSPPARRRAGTTRATCSTHADSPPRRAIPASSHADRVPPPAATSGRSSSQLRPGLGAAWPMCRSSSASPATPMPTHDLADIATALGVDTVGGPTPGSPPPVAAPVEVVSTTDADDEVRHAVRAVRRRRPPRYVVRPDRRPVADRATVRPARRAPPRRRRASSGTGARARGSPNASCRASCSTCSTSTAAACAGTTCSNCSPTCPPAAHHGERAPTAAWERASREAGVARTTTGRRASNAYAARERLRTDEGAIERAEQNAADAERSSRSSPTSGRRSVRRPPPARWSEWADWCGEQIERWVGGATLQSLDEAEYRAWEHTTACSTGCDISTRRWTGAPQRVPIGVLGRARRRSATTRTHRRRCHDGRRWPARSGSTSTSSCSWARPTACCRRHHDRPAAHRRRSRSRRLDDEPTWRRHAPIASSSALSHSAAKVVITYPRGDLRTTDHPRTVPLARSPTCRSPCGTTSPRTRPGCSPPCSRCRRPSTDCGGCGRTSAAAVTWPPPTSQTTTSCCSGRSRCLPPRRPDALTVYDGDLIGVGPTARPPGVTHRARGVGGLPARVLRALPPARVPDRGARRRDQHHGARSARTPRRARPLPPGDHRRRAARSPTRTGWTDEHVAALVECSRRSARHRARRTHGAIRVLGRRAPTDAGRPADVAPTRQRLDRRSPTREIVAPSSGSAPTATVTVAASRWPDARGRRHGRPHRPHQPTGRSSSPITRPAGADVHAISDADPTLGGTRFQLPAYAAATLAIAGRRDATGPRRVLVLRGTASTNASATRSRPRSGSWSSRTLGIVVDGIEAGSLPGDPRTADVAARGHRASTATPTSSARPSAGPIGTANGTTPGSPVVRRARGRRRGAAHGGAPMAEQRRSTRC